MATFAANYTARYFVRYRAMGKEHTFKVRYGLEAGAPPVGVVSAVTAFLAAMAPRLSSDWAVLSASYVPMGGTFSLPAVPPTTPVIDSTIEWSLGDTPRFYSFTARSVTGQPTAVMLYGALDDPGSGQAKTNDYRILVGEDAAIGAAIAALEAEPLISASDGAGLIWNPYANLAYNAYYQRKARRG